MIEEASTLSSPITKHVWHLVQMKTTRITIILTLILSLFFAILAAQKNLPTIAMIGLCVWSLRSAEHAIQALSL